MKNLLLSFLGLSLLYSLSAQDTNERTNTLSGLRSMVQPQAPNKTYFITDPGRQGSFVFDPSDRTSPDDSVMTLVTSGGLRFRRSFDQHMLNVRWFGATGNGATDDWYAIQKGIDYIINNSLTGRTLYFPPGSYKISKPLIIARMEGKTYGHASINLEGPANAKDVAIGSANIVPTFNNSFAIGVQLGKGVLIKDLFFLGRFSFPNKLNRIQIDTLSADEWTDGSSRQNPMSPYAGIVIDPFSDSTAYPKNSDMYPGLHGYCLKDMNRSGSTAVQVVGCSIRNFVIGVMVTPSNQQNGDLVDVIDCDLSDNKVAYAMGQAQSKECHVERLKCWGATHTIFDNVGYGFRHGDGANLPMVDGANIAGAVKQLCRVKAASFPGVFRNIYAEELYRLGFITGNAAISFEDCQIDFSTHEPGIPYPDFYILGNNVSFRNCMLRMYSGNKGYRLLLSGMNNYFEGGSMNEPPIGASMENVWAYANPQFKNVAMYYIGGVLGNSNPGLVALTVPLSASNGPYFDPVYPGNTYSYQDGFANLGVLYKFTYHNNYERTAPLSGQPVIHVNKTKWTAWFKLAKAADAGILQVGDFILTTGLPYRDQFKDINASTYVVGIIQRIDQATVYLDNLADGIQEGMTLPLWMDYYVYGNAPFIGDMAVGSNTLVHVQGSFPNAGDRPDMPMLPQGTFVTAVDVKAKTIRFSNGNNTGQPFNDFTFMNGYPALEMYSSFDPSYLQKFNKTLIGGADFYRYYPHDVSNLGANYFMNGVKSDKYKIINSNFNGDTTLHKLNYIREKQ